MISRIVTHAGMQAQTRLHFVYGGAQQARRSATAIPLTHLDEQGRARMVDISHKEETKRTARATASVVLGPTIYQQVAATVRGEQTWKKGDVLTVAELAGIQAAKNTATLIPLCHPVMLSHVAVTVRLQEPDSVEIEATAATRGGTGVEMEAMTAASVAALTVYDMCKAGGKGIVIRHVQLEEKTGGRSGNYARIGSGEAEGEVTAKGPSYGS